MPEVLARIEDVKINAAREWMGSDQRLNLSSAQNLVDKAITDAEER